MRIRATAAAIFATVTLSVVAQGQVGSGTVVGNFTNASPVCIPSSQISPDVYVPVCDAVGTSSVSWGNATGAGFAQSSLTFTPAPFLNVAVGQVFTLGTLRYFNGTTFSGTSIGAITLSIATTSATPALNGQVLLLPFSIFPTPNGVSPDADADFVYFSNATNFGSFRVREAEFATVQLLSRFGSLHNEGFGQIVAATNSQSGFLTSSIQAQLVPEPSTLLLSGVGVALVLFASRRRRT